MEQDFALDSYFEALLCEQLCLDQEPVSRDGAGAVAGRDQSVPLSVPQPAPPQNAQARVQQVLEAVIFTIDGLRLALPAEKLARIVEFPADILPAASTLPWYAGQFMLGETGIDIIDPAEIVIPPSHRVRSSDARRQDMRHLLLIKDSSWALACQEVASVTIEDGQIRRRTVRTRRLWLAGTVMSHACGLLDVDGLLANFSPL